MLSESGIFRFRFQLAHLLCLHTAVRLDELHFQDLFLFTSVIHPSLFPRHAVLTAYNAHASYKDHVHGKIKVISSAHTHFFYQVACVSVKFGLPRINCFCKVRVLACFSSS